MTIKAIQWLDNKIRILDQSKLPQQQVFIDLSDYQDVVLAIKTMQIRGAPAIGIAAAYGIALGVQEIKAENKDQFTERLAPILDALLDQAGIEQNNETRLMMYQQAEQMIVDEAPCLPLWFGKNYILVKPYVKGYELTSLGIPDLAQVYIEH